MVSVEISELVENSKLDKGMAYPISQISNRLRGLHVAVTRW